MFVFSPTLLRAARHRAGLSVEALAVAAGVSYPSIVAYERGARSPSRRTLLRLAAALKGSPRDLVDDDPAFAVVAR